jgi:Na+/H+-dicarboxylate symporter
MEQILNLIWIAIAVGVAAAVLPRRHDPRTIATLACFAAVLFPVISISDDMLADRTLLDAFAFVLVGFALALGLNFVSRISPGRHTLQLLTIATHSDPRSPPRA